ncbi:MAG: hypothetical protein R6X23_10635 [Acidimicrobiia bacterium]
MKEEGNFAILGRVVGVATSTLEGGGREAPNEGVVWQSKDLSPTSIQPD